jgi:hypothetical protein
MLVDESEVRINMRCESAVRIGKRCSGLEIACTQLVGSDYRVAHIARALAEASYRKNLMRSRRNFARGVMSIVLHSAQQALPNLLCRLFRLR